MLRKDPEGKAAEEREGRVNYPKEGRKEVRRDRAVMNWNRARPPGERAGLWTCTVAAVPSQLAPSALGVQRLRLWCLQMPARCHVNSHIISGCL